MRGLYGTTAAGWLLLVTALAGACAERRVAASGPAREAWAELKNTQGQSVGSAVFREEDGRVRIVVQAVGLTPGRHGIHIHAVARCEPPEFQSAGDHFNPLGKMHGLENPEGPHSGDLRDLEADANGRTEHVTVDGPGHARCRSNFHLRRRRQRHRHPRDGRRPAHGPVGELRGSSPVRPDRLGARQRLGRPAVVGQDTAGRGASIARR